MVKVIFLGCFDFYLMMGWSITGSSSPNSGQGLLRPTTEWGRQISYGACATNGNKKGCKDEGPNMDIDGPGWFNQDTCNFDCS